MSTDNKEFYDLLDQIVNEQTFDLELTNGQTVKCKQLSTAQLKELIKTVDDSPVTQTLFNNTSIKIFKDSIVSLPVDYELNVIDRLLFLLETRTQAISPTIVLTNSDNKEVSINLPDVKNKILSAYKQNKSLFDKQILTEGKLELTVETPLLRTEQQLNDEVYNALDVNADNIKEMIADLFINEIAKYLSSITLDKTVVKNFDLNSKFEERVITLQKLPTNITQKVISYIEDQKKTIEDNLIVEGLYLMIDSNFFTVS